MNKISLPVFENNADRLAAVPARKLLKYSGMKLKSVYWRLSRLVDAMVGIERN